MSRRLLWTWSFFSTLHTPSNAHSKHLGVLDLRSHLSGTLNEDLLRTVRDGKFSDEELLCL